ncbi:MAG: alpha/beta fold hydrolase [Pseudomonadota bacterium]
MNQFSFITLCALLAAGAVHAQDAPPPPGAMWLGQFKVDGKATPIILHDRSATQGAPSAIDMPMLNARGVPLAKFSMTPVGGRFEVQGGPELLAFDGKRAKGRLEGKVMQGNKAGSFTLVQAHPGSPADNALYAGSYQIAPGHVIDMGPMDEAGGLLVFLDQKTLRQGPLYPLSRTSFVGGPTIGAPYPFVIGADFVKDAKGQVTGLRWRDGKRTLLAKKIAPFKTEEVTVSSGDVILKGTLQVPWGAGPHPAVVFAHGSGDATRAAGFWNTFFTRQGIAVLSLDKRGVGASGGDWKKASMQDIANDWLAGVAMLKQRADIDAKRIGVHGSSQGGWTGALMAATSPDVAYLIARAGSADPVIDTMVYEIGWSVREAGFSEADAQEAQDGARSLFALGNASWAEFSAISTPLKAKPWANHAWVVHMSEAGWGRPWNALNAGFDPAATLARVKVPVLWFLGDLDHNVDSASTATRLAAARKASGNADMTVVRMPNAGHSFLRTQTGNGGEFASASYFAPGYFDVMEKWLKQRGLSQPKH